MITPVVDQTTIARSWKRTTQIDFRLEVWIQNLIFWFIFQCCGYTVSVLQIISSYMYLHVNCFVTWWCNYLLIYSSGYWAEKVNAQRKSKTERKWKGKITPYLPLRNISWWMFMSVMLVFQLVGLAKQKLDACVPSHHNNHHLLTATCSISMLN